jgi:hypothetical protein
MMHNLQVAHEIIIIFLYFQRRIRTPARIFTTGRSIGPASSLIGQAASIDHLLVLQTCFWNTFVSARYYMWLLAVMLNLNGEIIVTLTILQPFSFSFYSFYYTRGPSVSARILLKTRLESSAVNPWHYASGSTDPYHRLTDPDPYPAILLFTSVTFKMPTENI